MTGQKNNYTTLDKICGLADTQLSTPKHDELVLMLLNKEYVKLKIPELAEIDITKFVVETELPITAPNRFIIGYWDLYIRQTNWLPVAYIECKPIIASFGETMRQLNTYRVFLDSNEQSMVFLFTPDLRFKDAFESQGVKVISP